MAQKLVFCDEVRIYLVHEQAQMVSSWRKRSADTKSKVARSLAEDDQRAALMALFQNFCKGDNSNVIGADMRKDVSDVCV